MTPDLSIPIVVAFGGGVNSTAMLCGLRERDKAPSLILFADTGGETPETYEHVEEMDAKAREWWGVGIETVRHLYRGQFEGLEGNCLRLKMLPSLAYGRKGCSQKYKVQPQTRRMLQWMEEHKATNVIKAIGYDAGESHRRLDIVKAEHSKGRAEWFWYPLVGWSWRRSECIDAIKRHGIKPPGKSACFFCPAMKRGEIIRLKDEHPELFARAVEMERAANSPGGINQRDMGLTGRSLKWEDIGTHDEAQGRLWDFLDKEDETGIPCGCFDG